MGQIRKVGEMYYIEFYARGLMYSQVAGTSEEEAQKLLAEVQSKIAQGESLTIVREIDLDVFFERFLGYAKEKFSDKSLKRFTSLWKHWIRFLNQDYPHIHKLSQITPVVVESYKVALTKTSKPKIANLTILLLREILEYGIRIGFINDNPTLHISLLKLPLTKERTGPRSLMAKDLLKRSLPLEKVYSILKLTDVAQIMFWSNFIPLKREDIYS
jgi:hypothetical protein